MTTDLPSEPSDEALDEALPKREVRYEHSQEFLAVLEQLQSSLLISTYQAGKLAVVGTYQHELALSFHNFEQAMGIAVSPRRLAVGSKGAVWVLRQSSDIAQRLDPVGKYDACYLARSGFVTGKVHGHELAWSGDELWLVNTLFSCLCTIDDVHSFTPRWRPPFISSLAAEDRCHLNGFAMLDGQPAYVTVMAESDTPGGWRPTKATSGCVLEVPSGRVVARGFAMPHSPRLHQGRLFVLDSGKGLLCTIDPRSGQVGVVASLPGYTRGLAFHGPFAFVGLSKIRETSTFGGVPIAEHREELKCGVGIIHLPTGKLAGRLEFQTGVEEIFDVQVLPNIRCAALQGPQAHRDNQPTIWSVPLSARRAGDMDRASTGNAAAVPWRAKGSDPRGAP